MDDQEQAEALAPSRDILTTLARWGREKGYVAICNRLTGEVVEIPYRETTAVWRVDIHRLKPT